MEMTDSESSDDASGKSSKQSTDNTRRLKKKLKNYSGNWKLANIDQLLKDLRLGIARKESTNQAY